MQEQLEEVGQGCPAFGIRIQRFSVPVFMSAKIDV